jgi:hypothetical protein
MDEEHFFTYFATLYGKEVSHTHYPGASLYLFEFPEHAAERAIATLPVRKIPAGDPICRSARVKRVPVN